MAKTRNIAELSQYIRASRSQVIKAHGLALIRVTQEAEKLAKRNITREFIGRNKRRLSGRMLNATFSGFTTNTGQSLPSGFVGMRGIPYAAPHEFGAIIKPTKAKALWIKQHGVQGFKRLTPREFFDRKKNQKKDASKKLTIRMKNGKMTAAGFEDREGNFTPLFFLKDEVKIPARPYVQPAIREAIQGFPRVVSRELGKLLTSRFFK